MKESILRTENYPLEYKVDHLVKQEQPFVLATNVVSLSIKFTLYRMGDSLKQRQHGKVERIGFHDSTLTYDDLGCNQHDSRAIGDFDHQSAAYFLIDWLDKQIGITSIETVGRSIVNGGAHYIEPQRVTQELLDVPVFAHSDILRILIARWIELFTLEARCFYIDTASLSILGYDHDFDAPVIRLLNDTRHSLRFQSLPKGKLTLEEA
jgi:hypothetical protein